MTYDILRKEYSRQHINIVEFDLDFCTLTFGVGPCTATGSGDDKCYNTLETTQDLANYSPATKTYRFCEKVMPHPIGIDAIPSLININISPTIVDVKGGLGVRANVSATFADFTTGDLELDKYVTERTYIASERGTFWTKLRARNPDYQFKEMRVLSGYLVDGVFDAANFTTRFYVIDSLNVTSGQAVMVGKDPLRLSGANRAQAPTPSTGQLSADLAAGVLSFTLKPANVGNLEYDASGKILIEKEVISFTRVNDVMTIVRAQNNTADVGHSEDDTVQQCLEYSGDQVNIIQKNLLVDFANIDASFIPDSSWQAEVDTFLSGLLSGIIVKPTDVFKLVKELSEQMPHYLWWDERAQLIQLTALKAPPVSANALNMDQNFVADSVTTRDEPDMRISTVFVNFGQVDPTMKLDEPNNFRQTYARVDTLSIAKYRTNIVKTIFSRWITTTNAAAARQLAALIGRRFANTPRSIRFSLDAKDSEVWAGQNKAINHRDIVDFSGQPIDTIFQIISAKESGNFMYQGLEFTYGDELDEDEGGSDPGVDLVIFGSSLQDVDLRSVYDGLFTPPDASTIVKFVVENGTVIGSSSVSISSMVTGSWPAGAVVTLQINTGGFVVGRGGKGRDGSGTPVAEAGSKALELNYDLEIINNGVIGGGGGGGGHGIDGLAIVAGGGGAGDDIGAKGDGTSFIGIPKPLDTIQQPQAGTLELGGTGGAIIKLGFAEAVSGSGGNLGVAGSAGDSGSGGAAGDAIDKNGNVLTQTVGGDIRGSIT